MHTEIMTEKNTVIKAEIAINATYKSLEVLDIDIAANNISFCMANSKAHC